MAFSFTKAPVAVVKKRKKKRRRISKPSPAQTVIRKIRKKAAAMPPPSNRAEVVKLMAMVIDPDADQVKDELEIAKRKKARLRKAIECEEIYHHFLATASVQPVAASVKPVATVILRRGRKPLFRRSTDTGR